MKKQLCIIAFLLTVSFLLKAQERLEQHLNAPRPGDEIVKQQVFYKDPGRTGRDVLWDFGRLKMINESYKLSYSEPFLSGDSIYVTGADTLYVDALGEAIPFIGSEHYTRYYYLLSGDSLWILGHENSTNMLQYTQPLLNTFYPMSYGDSLELPYHSQGIYSGEVPFESEGKVNISADAYGKMILPSGDTLNHVMRIKSEQTIRETFTKKSGEVFRDNSILETYRWYSHGYRYPIFETIRSWAYDDDSTLVENFSTAFFYPPQEHYYLEDDEENLALLEETEAENVNPWAGLSYNLYPNPVSSLLYVDIYLPRVATLKIQVRSTMGMIMLNGDKGQYPAGISNLQLNVAFLPVGNYIVDIWLDDYLIGGIIMKR